ncbi:hypothetical protein CC2G_010954 [Coprinopsis cinerea AmutBmut pab1-1]|nr:hypothetical protein CC2G_010954 [Coprinopsis cinerea AmutBmut pab1-1]
MTCTVYRATMTFTDPNGVKHALKLSSSTPNPLRRTKVDMFEVNGEYIVAPVEGEARSIVSKRPSPHLHTIEEEDEVEAATSPSPQPPALRKASESKNSRSMRQSAHTLPESESDDEKQAMTALRKPLRRPTRPRAPGGYHHSDSENTDEEDTPKISRDTALKRQQFWGRITREYARRGAC